MTAAIGMHWNSNESARTEIDGVDENKTLAFNQKLLNSCLNVRLTGSAQILQSLDAVIYSS